MKKVFYLLLLVAGLTLTAQSCTQDENTQEIQDIYSPDKDCAGSPGSKDCPDENNG